MVVTPSVRRRRAATTPALQWIPRMRQPRRLTRARWMASARQRRSAELFTLGARFIDDHDLVRLKLMLLAGLIVLTAVFERIV